MVEVRDALTGAPAAQGATGSIQHREYIAALQPIVSAEPLLLLTSRGGPGQYSVMVQKSGYRDWVRRRVYVAAGSCGAKTVRLRADLQRSPTN
jgi:hypothetical protein